MKLFQRIILYIFPLYLTAMEQLIRIVFGSEKFSVSVVSSSVSVGGIALLLPLLVPIPITENLNMQAIEELKRRGIRPYKTSDQIIAVSAWFFLISMTFLWIFSLSKIAEEYKATFRDHDFEGPEIIAFVIYFFGMVHTEMKEFF